MLLGQVDLNTVRAVIDSISDGIQIYDNDGYLVYCNEKCEMLDDILSKSAIGKHVTSIYPPVREGANTIAKVLRTGQPIYNMVQDYINYRGRRLTAVTTTLPLMYRSKIVGVIEITRSLTENRELNEKIEKLRLETEALRLSGEIGMLIGPFANSGESAGSSAGLGVPSSEGCEAEMERDVDLIFERDEFVGFEKVVEIFEKRIIVSMLNQCRYHVTEAAERLKIPRQTLQYKMKKYGLKKPKENRKD